MADNEIIKYRGTNVASPIVPFTSDDNFPTHLAEFGKGGFRTVETIEDRNAIPIERREAGMLVYVINDDSNIHTYQWFPVDGDPNKEWKRSKMGGGDSIPIYDSAKLAELGPAAEKDHIFIRSGSDWEGQVIGNTYTTTKNGSYVDILFSAIRQLQSEVARLRNAFNYGIYSYSGTDTAMSRVQGSYEGDVEEEPLWAIDEDGLSLQEDLIENIIDFRPQSNINHTVEGLPCFNNTTTWSDSAQNIIKNIEDSKLFLYLTSNNLDITLNLAEGEEGIVELSLNLSDILDIPELDWYNILVVISRKQKVEEEGKEQPNYFGSNFIWISIDNPRTNRTIIEGYLDSNNQGLVESMVSREERYTIDSIRFTEGTLLSKAIIYSKYQDFSQEIIPSKPTDSDFSYKAAHITIRSVSTYDVLNSIKDQLPENELIFVEDTKKLYIKNNYKLVAISGAGNELIPEDETMTPDEILQALAEKGIITYDSETKSYKGLQPLGSITLINEDTGKQFEIDVDAYGNIITNEVLKNPTTLSSRLSKFSDFPSEEVDITKYRGFVGQLRLKEAVREDHIEVQENISAGLRSDRVKIGSFYAPARTQLTFGCSHGFIELENTSDKDFQLDGCYLHYARNVGSDVHTSHLALTGKVPANGTYLIRCKQYSDLDDPNVFIKVESFDIEWYDKDITVTSATGENEEINNTRGELIDLSHSGRMSVEEEPHGLALTYGRSFDFETVENSGVTTKTPLPFTYKSKVWVDNSDSNTVKKAKYLWWSKFIDGVYYNGIYKTSGDEAYWVSSKNYMTSFYSGNYIDAIYKNTFELDPAQQAYQALNTYDSSRYRNASANDYQYVLLNNEYISFPKTDEIYPVSKFTPKASFEGKNVLTDKNKLDPDIPNCVTCSFGINPYTTRTFNWVSSGYFDEYIWIREKDSTKWDRFSSYTKKSVGTTVPSRPDTDDGFPWRKEFDSNINNIIYNRIYGYFPGDKNCTYTSHKCILDVVRQAVSSKTTYEYIVGRSLANGEPDPEHTSRIMTFTLYPESYPIRIYQTTDQQGFHWIEYQAWGAAANYINNRIKNDTDASRHTEWEQEYARWQQSHTKWETTNQTYNEWKAAVAAHAAWAALDQAYNEWANDPNHDPSEEPEHPGSEPPIPGPEPPAPGKEPADPEEPVDVIPILMNTGDMTQSGCRVNEWVDYYNAGIHLFDHLEQVNCVGNNDLCGTNVTDLGTGDDIGKSNSFYFHVFYCYEVDTEEGKIPIINGKYIPSLYHIDFKDFRLVVVNSEITYENCKSWYKMVGEVSDNQITLINDAKFSSPDFDTKLLNGDYFVINIYTGWTVSGSKTPRYLNGFTTIYTILYNILHAEDENDNRERIVACHEMPFTVITKDNLLNGTKGISRSLSGTSLVGSHLNQLNANDNAANYWFSRLLEDSGVKLCIGGHKHTYAQTWPVREYYYYKNESNEWVSSETNGPMKMKQDLSEEKDSISWELSSGTILDAAGNTITAQESEKIHLSKFPIIEGNTRGSALPGYFSPGVISSTPSNSGVTYFMCQATGFKLMSNKELPAPQQIFSRYIPQSKADEGTADTQQRYPMYSVIDLVKEVHEVQETTQETMKIQGKLIRLGNIQIAANKLFNQLTYGTKAIEPEYLYDNSSSAGNGWKYGGWGVLSNNIIDIIETKTLNE